MADAMVIGLELKNEQAVVAGLRRVQQAVQALSPAWVSAENGASKYVKQIRAISSQASAMKSATAALPKLPNLPSIGGGGRSGSAIGPAMSQVASSLGMAGVAAEIAELANPVTAVVAGMTALVAVARAAAESLTQFKDAMVTSGGSAQQVAGLKLYGNVAGVSDTAAQARDLADRLASNGQAAAFGHQAGIHDYGGAYSDLNKASNLQKAIDHILSPRTSDIAAARFARVEGLESYVKMRGLSE